MTARSRNKQQSYCPNCGRPATGKFCTGCGSPLRGAACPECGAALQAGARFCQNCSHRIGGGGGPSSVLPWVLAASAGVVVVLAVIVTLRPTSPVPTALPTGLTSPAVVPGSTTPRGEADALFDRAMTAFESGDSAGAAFSGQMALNAYELIGALDADAHFHVGLLNQITGDYLSIVARADSIEVLVPTHLFAPVLRHRAGRLTGNQELMDQGYRQFLQRYDTEIAAARWEYEVHGRLVESFRAEAAAASNRD